VLCAESFSLATLRENVGFAFGIVLAQVACVLSKESITNADVAAYIPSFRIVVVALAVRYFIPASYAYWRRRRADPLAIPKINHRETIQNDPTMLEPDSEEPEATGVASPGGRLTSVKKKDVTTELVPLSKGTVDATMSDAVKDEDSISTASNEDFLKRDLLEISGASTEHRPECSSENSYETNPPCNGRKNRHCPGKRSNMNEMKQKKAPGHGWVVSVGSGAAVFKHETTGMVLAVTFGSCGWMRFKPVDGEQQIEWSSGNSSAQSFSGEETQLLADIDMQSATALPLTKWLKKNSKRDSKNQLRADFSGGRGWSLLCKTGGEVELLAPNETARSLTSTGYRSR